MANWSKKKLLAFRCNIHLAVINLSDEDAAETPELFPAWVVGQTYHQNDRFRYGDKLYRCEQPELVASDVYLPGAPGTESLYSVIAKPSDGTKEHPIAYNGNMALEQGKYYTQDGAVYYCFRDTGNPVYATLSALIGLYVNLVTD